MIDLEDLIDSARPRCEWGELVTGDEHVDCQQPAETVMELNCHCAHFLCFPHGSRATAALMAALLDHDVAMCIVHTDVAVTHVELTEL